jgi:two-component system OmpR family response regulator
MTAHPTYRFDGWTFDAGRRSVRNPAGELVGLTPRETALLQCFLDHPQQYLSRQHLVDAVYGDHPPAENDMGYPAMAVQVYRLRSKLQQRSDQPKIVTTRGGYWFCPAPEIVSEDAV